MVLALPEISPAIPSWDLKGIQQVFNCPTATPFDPFPTQSSYIGQTIQQQNDNTREIINKRLLNSLTKMYDDLKAGLIDLNTGYYAIKMLSETIAPLLTVENVEVLSLVVEGWKSKFEKWQKEIQKIKDGQETVKVTQPAQDEDW